MLDHVYNGGYTRRLCENRPPRPPLLESWTLADRCVGEWRGRGNERARARSPAQATPALRGDGDVASFFQTRSAQGGERGRCRHRVPRATRRGASSSATRMGLVHVMEYTAADLVDDGRLPSRARDRPGNAPRGAVRGRPVVLVRAHLAPSRLRRLRFCGRQAARFARARPRPVREMRARAPLARDLPGKFERRDSALARSARRPKRPVGVDALRVARGRERASTGRAAAAVAAPCGAPASAPSRAAQQHTGLSQGGTPPWRTVAWTGPLPGQKW